ncbi:common central of tyrosinase domain-containing protein [Penicillium desertorum]|uniref:Common central of tyrosinase domain-containing protein n=1 Tax=Penicillium desertorum TaxID=1303715 RepID=A0A9W9WHE0_9EURO|nr:common central of tyrosinase domain-containing protein [Penicillium desertorum]
MTLGDGIRRNIAHVDPSERALLRDAIKQLNQQYYPGTPSETPPGGVSWWFKQDEIHQSTHVHGGPEFLPWHREVTNRFEALLREINPQLSLHYWDFKEDPRSIPSGNLGGGATGPVNLFDPNFMGSPRGEIGEPWLSAGFYDPQAGTPGHPNDRDASLNPADPPKSVTRPSTYPGPPPVPFMTAAEENRILGLQNFGPAIAQNDQRDINFRTNIKPNFFRTAWEDIHNRAHPYFANISPHDAFRDPFVFLLHSNVDRIFAMWQCDSAHPERLDPATVYGAESNMDVDVFAVGVTSVQNLTHQVEPWSTGHGVFHDIRPWEPSHENQGFPHDYHHLTVVAPGCYDTLPTTVRVIEAENPGKDINFNDVPQGETASRAAVFEVFACGVVTLKVKSGPSPPYSVMSPPGDTVIVTSGHHQPQVARIWFQFTGVAPGSAPTGSMTVTCVETNEDFVFTIHGNTIPQPTTAVMLVLDQSGSMDWLAGTDATSKRIDVLHRAAANFCQLVQANNAVGMVSFDQTAYPGFDIVTLTGAPTDPNLLTMVDAIYKLQPQGATSIGNGIVLGRNKLNPVNGFDKKAMVVFTDGLENTPLYIADIAASLNAQTFAIGLGTAQQVSAGALNDITGNTGGHMLLSGPLSPSVDDLFRLQKYFLQVLAGVTNTSIVTDPGGTIFPSMKARIPFQLTEGDIDATAILLTDRRGVSFFIETPAGKVMTPVSAGGFGATFGHGTNMSYYRFTLPLALGAAREGTWYAILQRSDGGDDGPGDEQPHVAAASASTGPGVRFNFSVQSFTNIRMNAHLSQNHFEPGSTLTISATLKEYGLPVSQRAKVRADLERPDGIRATLTLSETDAGHFQATTTASVLGVYRVRVLASGVTMRGVAFTREQLLSAAAIPGGDIPPPTSGPSTMKGHEDLCKLTECLLGTNSLGRILQKNDVDPQVVLDCVQNYCKARLAGPTKEELAEREGTA